MANVRSQYIQSFMEEKKNLDQMMEDATKSTIEALMESNVKKAMHSFLNEEDEKEDDDDKSYEEEDLDKEDEKILKDNAEDGDQEDDAQNGDGDGDIWSGIKTNEDGEYDLRDMDKEDVLELIKTLEPEDGVVVDFNDGDLTITDDNAGTEYEINLNSVAQDGEDAISVGKGDGDDDELEFDLELDDEEGDEDDDELEFDLELDGDDEENGGIDDEDDDELEFDLELDGDNGMDVKDKSDESTVNTHATRITTSKKGQHRAIPQRNMSTDNNSTTGRTSDNGLSESTLRKVNQILKENAALKNLLPSMQAQLKAALVVNTSLGNIVKLVNENSTTTEEKKQLVERFNRCKTSDESNALYEQIKGEFANANKAQSNNFNTVLNGQITESVTAPAQKSSLNENKVTMDEGLYSSLDLLERMNKIR